MRAFLTFLAVLVACATAGAQQSIARVELDDGTVLRAPVERIDDRVIVLATENGPLTLPVERIVSLGPNRGGTLLSDEPPAEEAAGPAAGSADETAARGSETVLSRYAWLVPEGAASRISFAIGLVLGLTLLVHLAGRMAALETRGLGRCAVFSIVVLLAVGTELAVLPPRYEAFYAAVAVDMLLAFLCAILIFRADFVAALVMVLSFVLTLAVTALLALVGSLLVEAPDLM